MMFAELVVDLDDVGNDVGKALGRDVLVLPSLIKIVELWSELGVTVTAVTHERESEIRTTLKRERQYSPVPSSSLAKAPGPSSASSSSSCPQRIRSLVFARARCRRLQVSRVARTRTWRAARPTRTPTCSTAPT